MTKSNSKVPKDGTLESLSFVRKNQRFFPQKTYGKIKRDSLFRVFGFGFEGMSPGSRRERLREEWRRHSFKVLRA